MAAIRAAAFFGFFVSRPIALKRHNHEHVPVSSIRARGTIVQKLLPARDPSDYVLGYPAARFGLTEESALLDGATDEEWQLFRGTAPYELPGDAGPQFLQTDDPGSWCSSGNQAGYSVLNISVPTLVPFIVPQDQANRKDAAIIVAPGGQGRFLAWNREGTHIAKWLNHIGYSAFVLKYRVPANSLETQIKPVTDAQRAISLLKTQAPLHGLNSSRIGLMGFSFGAFIAGEVATQPERLYSPTDETDKASHLPDFVLELYGYGKKGSVMAPPTFIAVTLNDPCVPPDGALSYYQTLQDEGARSENIHELHVFSDGHHGFGDCSLYVTGYKLQPVCAWTVNAQKFLDRVLGVEEPLKHKPMIAPNL